MLNLNNQYTYLKKEILFRFFNFMFANEKTLEVNRLPYKIIPTGKSSRRCCIYKDREMIKYRLLALMGYDLHDDFDDSYTLQEYYEKVEENDIAGDSPLTVIKAACSACKKSQYRVTELCKGCLARPCQSVCPRDAISMKNGRAVIDLEKCINCGKCQKVCPYGSIVYNPVPCESVCPVGAIDQSSETSIEINKEKCISCGKCARSCPFGAIVERSHMLPIINHLKNEDDTTVLLAPAIVDQLPGSMSQIISGLKALGFSAVYELAESAQIVAKLESAELQERKNEGEEFMTTSCCPAYVEAVNRHIPALKPFVSHTPSPMVLGAEIVKKRNNKTKTVFIGPCIAKKVEAYNTDLVDYVMTFEELGALLIAREVELNDFPSEEVEIEYPYGLGFARSGGVAKAVEHYTDPEIVSQNIDGITSKTINLLRIYSKKSPKAELIEVMACEGGCANGPCTLC